MSPILLITLVGCFFILVFLGCSSYERHHLVTTYYEICQPDVPVSFDGKRFVFLTDLHNCVFGKENQDLIQRILDVNPDYILFGGDMIFCHEEICQDFSVLEQLLKAFYQKVPMFYGMGNHENRLFDQEDLYPGKKEEFIALLQKYGVKFLSNDQILLKSGEDFVRIADIDYSEREYKARKKLPLSSHYVEDRIGKSTSDYLILLSHSPLYIKEMVDYGANLVLSGHFHGGTVRLPILGGVMTPQYQFFYPHTRGLFWFQQKAAIVSGGLGTHTINIRFLNRPEVICITLRKEEKNGN